MTNCKALSLINRSCNIEIDYSRETDGSRILPFTIELDLASSILTPASGENQRFCYTITGVGEDASQYADLSHIVFGICEKITADQLANITVIRNGVQEEVVFGSNVELKSEQKPDPPTGCPGLKFDFGLDKAEGVMTVCFELLTVYPVGATRVCVYGGGVTKSGLYICGPACAEETTCPSVGYQSLDVCVPVTVTPYASIGATTTYCCGSPVVTPGANVCQGVKNGSCTFTITQKLCVAVPVEFGARAMVGEHTVECLGASAEDICENCTVD